MGFAEICLIIIVGLLALILCALMTAFGLKFPQGLEALKNLRKSNVDHKLCGVCAGFGKYTPVPAWIWRAIFLVLLFCGGIGFLLYIIFAICMPAAQD